MAKSTKRKAIRTRGNNLKRTVRRGRKLNRAVNNVKATKKRRKFRSRRTSRKVRKSLNQSGGLAGTAQQAIALFNRIFSIDGSGTEAYEQIKSIDGIFSDTINGSDSSDEIFGGKGSDKIYGKDGPDMIKGGQGNDTIYGGGNGLDNWGNPGDDVAVYSGIESRYTVSFYDSKGNASKTGYQSDGFVKVVDSSTDETASEGKQAPLLIDCPWLYSNLNKK